MKTDFETLECARFWAGEAARCELDWIDGTLVEELMESGFSDDVAQYVGAISPKEMIQLLDDIRDMQKKIRELEEESSWLEVENRELRKKLTYKK